MTVRSVIISENGDTFGKLLLTHTILPTPEKRSHFILPTQNSDRSPLS
ncbi:hypothetical protein PN473_05740 [Dolichospermum circinale CS-545/17]|uniref:Uncharacterized protein n=1 Tax=Dolichospermum circinale CS-537/01 TaxID=3021739 RepID=A0ABT4ZZF2_9CYAN|nr:hypothetical protein [Dolichospermum circinale]MDB9457912.1 hypothetical protein [Dolichospermum circinale CS-545/17]MDB9485043.1 hypothetical protein [Dolichospermum circinale CS-537/01]